MSLIGLDWIVRAFGETLNAKVRKGISMLRSFVWENS